MAKYAASLAQQRPSTWGKKTMKQMTARANDQWGDQRKKLTRVNLEKMLRTRTIKQVAELLGVGTALVQERASALGISLDQKTRHASLSEARKENATMTVRDKIRARHAAESNPDDSEGGAS